MIKRYHVFGDVAEAAEGDYVSYDDYAAAEAARLRLVKHFGLHEMRGVRYDWNYLADLVIDD